jgi:hypothetical protein
VNRARNLLYDSASYFVLESPGWGGIEVVDKQCRRGAFLAGPLAVKFRSSIVRLAAHGDGRVAMDKFLRRHAGLYTNPLVLH